MKIINEYRKMHYKIESSEKGSSYSVYEYTPILKAKHEAACGSCCDPKFYTEEYVKSIIDDIIYHVNESEK